ncbi:MAG: glycosylase, partial [Chitinophagales bacterium]
SPDQTKKTDVNEFPEELVHFVSYANNPIFLGSGTNAWDKHIRERGWILKEDSTYYMWYTGYIKEEDEKHLGYATSSDGYHWSRFPSNPIYSSGWAEDMCVVKSDSLYYMFSEGRGDTAHMLTSPDKLHWTEKGNLDIRQTNGKSITAGPYGTPTVLQVDSEWYLLYERNDQGIWLAQSKDFKTWTNLLDSPVLRMGPGAYDKYAVAMNQVIKYRGLYYGYYHATAFPDWREWSTNVAVSPDLIHWKKYPGNPILKQNKSSGIMINDGRRFRLYTMHDSVNVHFPVTDSMP